MSPQLPEPFFASIYQQVGELLATAGYGQLAISRMFGRPGNPLPQFIKMARLKARNPYGPAAKQYNDFRLRALEELEQHPPARLNVMWTEWTLIDQVATIATADLRPRPDALTIDLVESRP